MAPATHCKFKTPEHIRLWKIEILSELLLLWLDAHPRMEGNLSAEQVDPARPTREISFEHWLWWYLRSKSQAAFHIYAVGMHLDCDNSFISQSGVLTFSARLPTGKHLANEETTLSSFLVLFCKYEQPWNKHDHLENLIKETVIRGL